VLCCTSAYQLLLLFFISPDRQVSFKWKTFSKVYLIMYLTYSTPHSLWIDLPDCTSLSYIRSTLFTLYKGFTVEAGSLTCTPGTQTLGYGLCWINPLTVPCMLTSWPQISLMNYWNTQTEPSLQDNAIISISAILRSRSRNMFPVISSFFQNIVSSSNSCMRLNFVLVKYWF